MRRTVLLLASLAFGVLYGCSQASSPPERQEKQAGVEEAAPATATGARTPTATGTQTPQQAPKPVKGSVGEPVDVGSATVEVTGAFKTENDPKVGTESYEGEFVIVFLAYTPGGKKPVVIPEKLALTLEDSEGRIYALDEEQGIAGSYADNRDLGLPEEFFTVNPGVRWETVVAFPVGPDASGFTLRGGDLACPQCGKEFQIDLGF
jgi:hypothetical protein